MLIILTIIFFLVDLVSKLIVSNLMNVHDSIEVISNFFNISYFRNTGGAWSILNEHTWILIVVSLLIIIFIGFYVYKNKIKNKLELLGYSMILGGSIGNLLDRILYGYVIDFLDFNIFGYDYPIFNFADIFIVLGVFLLIIDSFRGR